MERQPAFSDETYLAFTQRPTVQDNKPIRAEHVVSEMQVSIRTGSSAYTRPHLGAIDMKGDREYRWTD